MGSFVSPYAFAAGGAVADAWVIAWEAVGGQNAISGFTDKTFRMKLPSSALKNSLGTKFRLTFKAGGDAMTISDCFFGIAAASGDPYDFSATPLRVTFDGGASGSGSIPAGTTKLSDEMTFTIAENTDYLVTFHNSAGDKMFFLMPSLQDGVVGWYKAGNDASTVDASGYQVGSEIVYASYGLVKFEIFGHYNTTPGVPAVPKDPFGSYVVFMFTADDGIKMADAALAPFGDYTSFDEVQAFWDGSDWVLYNTSTLDRGYIQWLAAHDEAFNVRGGDWTIEGYLTWPTGTPTAEIFSYRGNDSFFVRRSMKFWIDNGVYKMYLNGDTADFEIASSVAVTANTRQHVAVSRVGNKVYLFLAGALVAQGTYNGNVNVPFSPENRIALNVYGQYTRADDWRFTNGIGRYHAAFTPPAHLTRPGVTPVSPDDHKYWRILVTQNNGQPYVSIGSALRMYASLDGSGANLVTSSSGVISSSADAGVFGNDITKLMDNNDGTQWAANKTGNEYVTFKFNLPVNVGSIAMKVSTAGGQEGLMAMDFSLRYSNDGSTYTQKFAKTGVNWLSGASERVFTA